MMMSNGGPSRAATAVIAPATPPKRAPNTTEKLIVFGPGRNCDSAKVSLNSCAVIQPLRSTIIRRDHGSAPPNDASDTAAKARNNSDRVGRTGAGAPGDAVESDMTATL